MDAFSVAEHDIGVQPVRTDFDMTAVEERIKRYTNITDTYELAMENGNVNGVDLTINVLDEPKWFHVIEGSVADDAEELLVTRTVAGDLGVYIGDEVTVSAGGSSAVVNGKYFPAKNGNYFPAVSGK